jgi:hypothetical protein
MAEAVRSIVAGAQTAGGLVITRVGDWVMVTSAVAVTVPQPPEAAIE